MTAKRISALAIALLFGMTSCACLIGAHEDEGAPLMITAPDGDEPISCAVFFADNMVYAPQWRLDNYVRIEKMVLDMTEFETARDITVDATDLYPSEEFPDELSQQAAIMTNSEEVLPLTKMVSVSYIEVAVTSDVLYAPIMFAAGWNPETGESVITVNGLGREVNKAGHLIYGTLWDTTHLDEGIYTVEVRLGRVVQDPVTGEWSGSLGEWYSVDYSIGHLYNPEGEEGEFLTPDYPYSDLVEYEHPDYTTYKIGAGGVEGDCAWVELGPLIPQGSGGGNGGDSGGNGNGGDGGNGNGGAGGNGHGGRLSRLHGK